MNLYYLFFLSAIVTSFTFCQTNSESINLEKQHPLRFVEGSNACSSLKQTFNGVFNCTDHNDTLTCTISCPEGSKFEFSPSPVYTCNHTEARFLPEFIPQCIFDSNKTDLLKNNYSRFKRQSDFDSADTLIETEKAHPGSCFMWGGSHVKTFDGEVYSFRSPCAHTLVRDEVDNTFSVIVQESHECAKDPENCFSTIRIYLQDKEYILKRSVQGMPIFASANRILPLPGHLPGIRAEMLGNYIVVFIDSIGVKIKWDREQFLQVQIQEGLWNKTTGLCGKIDGNRDNDLFTKYGTRTKSISTLVSSWQVDTLGDECEDDPIEKHMCEDPKMKGRSKEAIKFCTKLFSDKRFAVCNAVMDIRTLFSACIWDYCSCRHWNSKQCACETLNVYVRECVHKGITALANWRDENTCPMECPGGRIFMPCAPAGGQINCGEVSEILDENTECEEGCYCPHNTVLHNSKCVPVSECPCWYHGEDYPSGSTVPKDCNNCTCVNGKWDCTKKSCNVRCSVIGDPHYTTFDGKRFDFMGACSYYLVEHENFTIEAENEPCFAVAAQGWFPSCAKSVTVKIPGQAIQLKRNREIIVNGMEMKKLPFDLPGITVRAASSSFIIVTLQNGVEIWWDSSYTAYIDIPPQCKGKTKGLCGTYNLSQKDDFLTPEGDVEHDVNAFANKWKTSEKCEDIPEEITSHPCAVNVQNKPAAEKYCKIIKSDLFSGCHQDVDPEPFYQDCMYDMCSCNQEPTTCFCPMIAAYARECALKEKHIEWTNVVTECSTKCPSGQYYQICGNSCARTCYDIAMLPNCQQQCVEGCNCPPGEALDHNEECLSISQCGCQHNGLHFPAAYKQIRPTSTVPELCTCINARWSCRRASSKEIKEYPNVNDVKTQCNTSTNMEFTPCEPTEPITCKNMHSFESVSTAFCQPGCQCKKGYVLDGFSKTCVKATECQCHHNGRSYNENSTVQNDCNTCVCIQGKWQCTEKICPAECTAWGDSHYKTFDGRLFDYQGQCDYILAKGSLGNDQVFDISSQNVPCGSLGVSCSKSITIRVGAPPNQESFTLTQEKEIPEHATLRQLVVRQKGHFVIVEAPELGFIVKWDKGTRVYIKLDPQWKNKVKGLCGNYNSNELDDFQTPSGGVTEVSALLFGDSWRLQPYCSQALDITDTCERKPERKIWALKKCGLLKSSVFAKCHSEVPVEIYLDRCIFDTCACDQGGDCDCLCTALSAYAQECNNKGIPIKWRTPELCPMQCDERCSHYDPCISTCPTETCDNMLLHGQLSKMCDRDACIEGCQVKPCPIGFIYSNSSLLECVPRNTCLPLCLETNGKQYYEGDLIEEDACHSCYCSRGKKTCQGQPCTTTPVPIEPEMEAVKCVSGWTVWLNQDKHFYQQFNDVEPLPTSLVMNNLDGSHCDIQNIIDIECRTVLTHVPSKQTGLDVECSLERGLVCSLNRTGQDCVDFEIRVLCDCGELTTVATQLPEITTETCDVTQPAQEHPSNCHLFYYCKIEEKPTLTEVACGPHMMFHPVTLACDVRDAVIAIKPECAKEVQCPPGEMYQDCAVECHRLCMYYSKQVKRRNLCRGNTECESSCVSEKKMLSCPPGFYWTNNETCVVKHDCMCLSDKGEPVKPGVIVKESECKICQCIDNYYTCDESLCGITTAPVTPYPEEETYSTPVIAITTTVTPPFECNEEDFINLIDGDFPLSDEAFGATSMLNEAFAPKYARFSSTTGKSGGSWIPETINVSQHLDINLGYQEPVYGVVIKGNPKRDEYVTSYKVMYSPDGHSFSFVMDPNKHPQIFEGSVDGNTPSRRLFNIPIEAQIIRINPQTWHNNIALQVELIGCGEFITSTVPATIYPIRCDYPMGVNNGLMADQQMSVSSELNRQHGKSHLRIDGKFAWQPLTNSPSEWIQFDFLEPRIITGLITKGGRHGWITKFNVKYSHNGNDWNAVLDDKSKERAFFGNIDENTPQTTRFDLPIRAELLKIIPVNWHRNIQLRIEPVGCFEPYPESEEEELVKVPPSLCNNCPGAPPDDSDLCQCKENLWWNGNECVERSQCPCMVGHIPYAVGTVFQNEDCSQCICKLGGITHCTPLSCHKCEQDLRSVITSTCGCICQPCDEGTVLCPSSNTCINIMDWCNGIKDCSDDETNCSAVILPSTQAPTESKELPKKCSKPACQAGYKFVMKNIIEETEWSPRTMFTFRSRKGGRKTSRVYNTKKTAVKTAKGKKTECMQFECVSQKTPPCPEVFCPSGYVLEEYDSTSNKETCPGYECKAPVPLDAVCNITGQTWNTFDNVEYKYDICNHILARNLHNKHWEIFLKKQCVTTGTVCSRDLIIHHDNHVFVFHPDLSIEFDGYHYTIEHTKKIGFRFLNLFSINQLGDALVFVSNKHGFWVIWNNQQNVKIGISNKLLKKVDGLCGYFNDEPNDDKRKPDGKLAKTTAEFGESWVQPNYSKLCDVKACPLHIQNKAWEMCNLVKEETFATCSQAVNLDAFISRCLETTCTCLEGAPDNKEVEEKCRCLALQNFVVDCLTANSNLEIIDWRMKHGCPVNCEAPLVHHDCYRRRCEPSCGSLNSNLCPKMDHVCFPGCYCPAGYVRKGKNCILPTNCGDCECNVLPHLEYITYDEKNFTVDGNCTYIMSQDIINNKGATHKFRVLITNYPCKDKVNRMCIEKVRILYGQHEMQVIREMHHKKLQLIVNLNIASFADVEKWAHITEDSRKHLRIFLHEIQIHISVYYPSLGVSIKAPSLKYGGKLEGLCGNCNDNADDDLQTPNGVITSDIGNFSFNWLYDGYDREQCINRLEEKCEYVPVASDPCMQLKSDKYQQCNPVLDPGMFIEWCKKDTCNDQPELSCDAIEAYSLECGHLGFCIDWRTNLCPAKQCPAGEEYKACAPACPQTCEALKENEIKCTNAPIEGCFCLEGKVFLNGTCVAKDRCESCDDEGHRSGDIWHQDPCTRCTCEGTSVKCETRQCPDVETICEDGFRIEKVSSVNECCDKYICVQLPTTTSASVICEIPQQQSCSEGQIMKLIKKADGCQQYVCECKPIEDCEPVDADSLLNTEPGIVKEIDKSGCCPVVKEPCRVKLCPDVPVCPQFHTAEKSEGKCCPKYICVPPKHSCIVDLQYIADEEGGERPRVESEKKQVLRKGNAKWQDGPCRECECIITPSGDHQGVCTIISCPAITELIDHQDYLIKPEPVVGQCCPNIKKVACKHDGKIYEVGEIWPLQDDYCTTIECVENPLGIQKLTQVTTCDTSCELGWEYVPVPPELKICCGSCKPVACVVDGVVYKDGEKWTSNDRCTNYYCSNSNGSMQIESSVVDCPSLSDDLLNNYVVEIIPVEGECCKKHKVVACKVGNQHYKVGQAWPSNDGNKCKKITCDETVAGKITKQEVIETCNTNCSKGWTYKESDSKCCGECIQTACVTNDELKQPGDTWESPDGCTTFSCDDKHLTISSFHESCPDVENCPPEDVRVVGCCRHCISSGAQVQCAVEKLNVSDTIGLISVVRSPHGKCTNKKGLRGFTECNGVCKSYTRFNSESGQHESTCLCCQVVQYEPYIVHLECEDGHRFKKQVAIPSECGCEACTSEKESHHLNVEPQ